MTHLPLIHFGEVGVSLLQESLESKGLNASRTLSNSIKAEVTESLLGLTLTIYTTEGARYWQVLNAASRRPSKRFHSDVIFEWSKTKGISFNSDEERRSFAHAVVTNIAAGDYMFWNRDQRKNFATDAINSPEWTAAETTAIAAMGEQLFEPFDTFFTRPQEAEI